MVASYNFRRCEAFGGGCEPGSRLAVQEIVLGKCKLHVHSHCSTYRELGRPSLGQTASGNRPRPQSVLPEEPDEATMLLISPSCSSGCRDVSAIRHKSGETVLSEGLG